MNDGERLIDEEIRFIEKELVNLKTAHQRPLGALDFFTKTETIPISLTYSYGSYWVNFWVDVKVIESNVKPPVCQVGWDVPDGFMRVDILDYTISSDYTTFSYKLTLDSATISQTNFKVSAVSSMPIDSITVRSA